MGGMGEVRLVGFNEEVEEDGAREQREDRPVDEREARLQLSEPLRALLLHRAKDPGERVKARLVHP